MAKGCCSEPLSRAAIHLECTCSGDVEALTGRNYIGNDFIFLRGNSEVSCAMAGQDLLNNL